MFPTGETPLLNAAAALAELNQFTDENHGYELRQVSEINRETARELTGHGLPLSKCGAYNRVHDQPSESH